MKESKFRIYETTNYSKFKTMEGNRAVKDGRVNRIVESINKVGYVLSPILVNEKMEVIDGQGRLSALERLGLPVHYMVQNGIGIEECRQMNIHQSNWTNYDYVVSYAIMGNENYQRLQSLCDRFAELPAMVVVSSATNTNSGTGGSSLSTRLRKGALIISETDYERSRWELDYASKMSQVAKTIGGKKDAFYTAVIYAYRALNSEGRNKMEEAIRQHAYDFPALTKPVDYLRRFDGYYNDIKNWTSEGENAVNAVADAIREKSV